MLPKLKRSESIGQLLEGEFRIAFYILSDQVCSASFHGNTAAASEEDFEVVLD